MTLVEVLIVVGLISLLGGTLIFGSGLLGSNRLRAAAGTIVSGVRLGISRANTTGQAARLVFDLEQQRVVLEETSGKFLRGKDGKVEDEEGDEEMGAVERRARAYANDVLAGPGEPKAQFTPVKEGALGAEGEQAGKELGRGVRFAEVQTEHDEAPRRSGKAYLYFWPGGGTERAVVQLEREGDREGYTVVVSPLTGRARIERGKVELEDPREDFGEREEE